MYLDVKFEASIPISEWESSKRPGVPWSWKTFKLALLGQNCEENHLE